MCVYLSARARTLMCVRTRVTQLGNFVYLALFRACQNYYLVSRKFSGGAAAPGHVQTSGKRPDARQRRRIFAVACERNQKPLTFCEN